MNKSYPTPTKSVPVFITGANPCDQEVAPPSPAREGSLVANIGRIHDALTDQTHIITELFNQLEPVVVQTPEVNTKETVTPSPCQTPTMGELYGASQRIYANTARLQDIINRLQIR